MSTNGANNNFTTFLNIYILQLLSKTANIVHALSTTDTRNISGFGSMLTNTLSNAKIVEPS